MKYDLDYINKNEVWIPVVGYEGLYEISSFGNVRSLGNGGTYKTQRIMKQFKNTWGYLCVGLCKNGKSKHYQVHRLVAIAFIENPENFPQVNHKDENISNNNVNNLEWCSAKYNINYGTCIKRSSEKQINGKKSKQVLQFTKTGEFIAEFPSTREVKRQLGFLSGNISRCCHGKLKYAYGYVWKYK